jgi:hypothetical protein
MFGDLLSRESISRETKNTLGATHDQSANVAGEFARGQESVLRINFNNHGEMNLSLQ